MINNHKWKYLNFIYRFNRDIDGFLVLFTFLNVFYIDILFFGGGTFKYLPFAIYISGGKFWFVIHPLITQLKVGLVVVEWQWIMFYEIESLTSIELEIVFR